MPQAKTETISQDIGAERNSHVPANPLPIGLAMVVILFVAGMSTGCQSNRVRWNLFNWQNLERVPPPSTGTLSIPGVNTTQFPTSNLPAPPTTLPNGSNLPYVNPSSGTNGGINPGVYFNNSAPQSGQWQNSGDNVSANGTLSTVPGRSASAAWTPSTQPSMGAVATGFNPGNNVSAVPPLLNSQNFDPFSTDRIPSWNPNMLAQSQPTPNPLTVTSPNRAASANTQLGWWPNQDSYNSQASYNGRTSGIGSGQLLRSMQESMKGVFNQQPANLGGFQTTTPIDNPMILATGYQGNMPNRQTVQQAAQPNPLGNTQVNPQVAAQQWAEYQQRQLDLMRAQQMQQLQTQAAVNPAMGAGAGPMQVLAVNTTSEIAENQSRMGIRTAASQNLDPRYSGQVPQGSAAVAPRSQIR